MMVSKDGTRAVIPVVSVQEAEDVILAILRKYAEWLAARTPQCSAQKHLGCLLDQFGRHPEKYAYEQPLQELRRTGKMDQWTPQPLRLYVTNWPSEGRQVLVCDNSYPPGTVQEWLP